MRDYKRLWIGIGLLILLSPLGILVPELLKAGSAWGEWGVDEIADWMQKEGLPKFIPDGLRRLSEIWSAPFPGYTFRGWEEGLKAYISYILTGLIGVAAVSIVTYIINIVILRKGRDQGRWKS